MDEEKSFPKTIVESGRSEAGGFHNSREERTVYGLRLIEAMIRLFFMPGFTISDDKHTEQSLWAGTKTKAPTAKVIEQRMILMEALIAVIYCGEVMGRSNLVNPFIFYMSAYETVKSNWTQRLILSLINTGLKVKENGYLPYVSHLYIQENETRSSVLSLSLLAALTTREHKIDAVSQALDVDPFMNLIAASLGDQSSLTGGQLPSLYSMKIDHLTKYLTLFDDVHSLTIWLSSLYQNIRNPLDYSNTILPGSMKKVVLV